MMSYFNKAEKKILENVSKEFLALKEELKNPMSDEEWNKKAKNFNELCVKENVESLQKVKKLNGLPTNIIA